MAGFLESAGRGNAFAPVNNVLGRAVELRQAENQDSNQAFGKAIELDKLGMMKEDAAREKTKFDWATQKQAQETAIRDTPVPLTSLLGSGWDKDPAKKMQFDKMKEKGLVNEVAPGVFMTTMGYAGELKKYAATDLEWTKQVNEQNLITTNNQLTELQTALSEEKNPKKVDELNQQIASATKKLSDLTASHKRLDFKQQNEMEKTAASAEGKLAAIEAGANIRAEASKETATIRADAAKEVASARADASKEAARIRAESGGKADSTEEKRKVKALDTARKEVERIYGYSQFLPTAQDPKLIEKVGKGKALVEDIMDNPEGYGLKKEPTPGKAADMAKTMIESQYNKKPVAAAPVDTVIVVYPHKMFHPNDNSPLK